MKNSIGEVNLIRHPKQCPFSSLLFSFIFVAIYTANLAASFTISRVNSHIASFNDLINQREIDYATLLNSHSTDYFQRMARIETEFANKWKQMVADDSLSPINKKKLAVWDYPLEQKYTKMWNAMKTVGFPTTIEEAVHLTRNTDFAFIGESADIRYHAMVNCELVQVDDEISRRPYAIAIQQGSPLKDEFDHV